MISRSIIFVLFKLVGQEGVLHILVAIIQFLFHTVSMIQEVENESVAQEGV